MPSFLHLGVSFTKGIFIKRLSPLCYQVINYCKHKKFNHQKVVGMNKCSEKQDFSEEKMWLQNMQKIYGYVVVPTCQNIPLPQTKSQDPHHPCRHTSENDTIPIYCLSHALRYINQYISTPIHTYIFNIQCNGGGGTGTSSTKYFQTDPFCVE